MAKQITDLDRQLHGAYREKLRLGVVPTRREEISYERVRKEQLAQARGAAYAACPQREYLDLCGIRSRKVLADHAEKYGVPCSGETIDIGEVLTWFHRLLRSHGRAIQAAEAGEVSPETKKVQLQNRKLEEEIRRLRMKGDREAADTIPRDVVHTLHGRMAAILRSAMQLLRKQHGNDAGDILDEAIYDFTALLKKFGQTYDPEA